MVLHPGSTALIPKYKTHCCWQRVSKCCHRKRKGYFHFPPILRNSSQGLPFNWSFLFYIYIALFCPAFILWKRYFHAKTITVPRCWFHLVFYTYTPHFKHHSSHKHPSSFQLYSALYLKSTAHYVETDQVVTSKSQCAQNRHIGAKVYERWNFIE